jgi:DNA sulfur modification protein DndD
MILVQITLQNFRAYHGENTIELLECARNKDKNIVAVGGLNGAGKTTLLDGIVYALLGVSEAHKFLEGVERKAEGRDHIDRAFDGLLNREARASGEREASVTLVLRDRNENLYSVKRMWHYDYRGDYKNEELLITGQEGAIPPEQYEDFLKNQVPPQIAKFFFFDGEKIQAIAQDEVGTSVREGIDLMLGFHVLDVLVSDMDTLIDTYRKETNRQREQENELSELRTQETRFVNKMREIDDEQVELEEKVDVLKEQNRKMVDELNALLGGGDMSPKDIQRQLDQTNETIRTLKEELLTAIDRSIIPSLPAELLGLLSGQLDGEEQRFQWEEGKRRVEPQRNKLLDRVLGEESPRPEPPLQLTQVQFFRDRIRQEWDDLFNPPPAGIAAVVIHGYLSSEERAQVRNKCLQVLRSGTADIRAHITKLDTAERKARDLRQQLAQIGDGKRANEIIEAKTQVDRELGEKEQAWELHKRQLQAIQVDLKDVRQKIQKKEDELLETSKSGDRAGFARKIKKVIQQYQEALRPRKRDEVASNLTEMYRRLARKEDVVDRIEFDEKTYRPRLLDRRGNSMPLHTLSAGEREIYALALLWALAKASRRDLPVVIDTPLARLDSQHRANIVKKYLPAAGPQVIVLSTDTELDRQYFDLIKDNVAVSLLLDFDPKTERTTIRKGFFDFN